MLGFYDISTLVGFWSSIYIRKDIYIFCKCVSFRKHDCCKEWTGSAFSVLYKYQNRVLITWSKILHVTKFIFRVKNFAYFDSILGIPSHGTFWQWRDTEQARWDFGKLDTNIYWYNSKMTPISYNYNTEYTTKWKHFAEWYDVAINNTRKTCSLLVKF